MAKLVLPIDFTDKVMDQQDSASDILPDLDVWRAQRALGEAHQSGGGSHTEAAGPGPHPRESQAVKVQLLHEVPHSLVASETHRPIVELAGALHCWRGGRTLLYPGQGSEELGGGGRCCQGCC